MVARRFVGTLTAVVLSVACGRSSETGRVLQAGDQAPTMLRAWSEDRVRVVWIFSGADLQRCRSSAVELRHVRMAFGAKVDIVAVAVDAERPAVESFLRYKPKAPNILYSIA